jgi:hypothetical protein
MPVGALTTDIFGVTGQWPIQLDPIPRFKPILLGVIDPLGKHPYWQWPRLAGLRQHITGDERIPQGTAVWQA